LCRHAHSLFISLCIRSRTHSTTRYDTTILTCAQKLTGTGLAYRFLSTKKAEEKRKREEGTKTKTVQCLQFSRSTMYKKQRAMFVCILYCVKTVNLHTP